jgi:hypothetical protein
MTDLCTLRMQYAPYDQMPAFDEGFAAYPAGSLVSVSKDFHNPYRERVVQRQCQSECYAWDRGFECASRWAHLLRAHKREETIEVFGKAAVPHMRMTKRRYDRHFWREVIRALLRVGLFCLFAAICLWLTIALLGQFFH